jgi:hypothetical protein
LLKYHYYCSFTIRLIISGGFFLLWGKWKIPNMYIRKFMHSSIFLAFGLLPYGNSGEHLNQRIKSKYAIISPTAIPITPISVDFVG